jgi:uncharacterized protein with HEPN domain
MCGKRDESLILDDMVVAAGRLAQLADSIPACGEPPREVLEMVLWNFTQLGEAAKRLSPALRGRFVEVPWSEMAGMRDRVVHDYGGVSWDRAREIATVAVPAVLPCLVEIRDQLRAEYDSREEPAYYSARRTRSVD